MIKKTKKCSRCGQEKSPAEFGKRSVAKDGLNSACLICSKKAALTSYYKHHDKNKVKSKVNYYTNKERYRNNRLLWTFGISLAEYDKLLEAQNGVCAICRKHEITKDKFGNIKRLAVDHDHQTEKVRGLLCDKCNHALGNVNDNIDILYSMIDYLNKNKGTENEKR